MEEKFLYHIWDEGHLATNLLTRSGKPVKVVYPGQYNTSRGPDFFNCILEIGGETIRGAVEIHLHTNDWQAHNHQEDIYYNDVVLHVVLEHNSPYEYTISENGNHVEILEIQNQLSDDITKLIQQHSPESRRQNYCNLLSAIDADYLEAILTQAGLRRFWAKVKRFNASLVLSSFDQVFYEGLMEAMGYVRNRMNTLTIAHCLNLETIKDFKQRGMDSEELISLFLCPTGLLDKSKNRVPEQTYNRLLNIYEQQNYYARHLDIDWQLFRIRPTSHPLSRLVVIAEFIWDQMDKGILSSLLPHSGSFEPNHLYKSFKHFMGFKPKFGGNAFQPLGASVVATIYLNIYLPVLALWAQKTSDDAALESVVEAYKAFKGLEDNFVLRFMNRYLSNEQIKIIKTRSLYQQGLMDIYNRFCNWHYCDECLSAVKNQ